MWRIGDQQRVFVALGVVDMRKAINGLSLLVEEELGGALFDGDLFVFCNRSRTMVKVLYWDRNGFCLWHKRLEKDRFRWPEDEKDVIEIGARELGWLLDGLDLTQAHETLCYEAVS